MILGQDVSVMTPPVVRGSQHDSFVNQSQIDAFIAYREVSVRLLALEKQHLALKAEWTEALAAMNRTFEP